MQLTTERRSEKVSNMGVASILYQPIIITAYDIFPSQYRPGKEAARIEGWTEVGGEFTEINVVTEGKSLIDTLKDVQPGNTYETMIVKDSRTGRYLFSNVTKDQQKKLIKKLDEKRQQYIKQSLTEFFDKQGNVPSGPFRRDGEALQ